MRIAIIGAGYVGLVTGACLAKLGNEVTFVDSDKERIDMLRGGKCPIYEAGLDEILRAIPTEATCNLDDTIKDTSVSFVCVGTDSDDFGYATNLQAVKEVAEEIGKTLSHGHLVVIKSTVIPGTTENVIIPLLEKHGRRIGTDFNICTNPEFLREGIAVRDFLHPDRIIIGEMNKEGGDVLAELYRDFDCPILRFELRTAEMIKYASNAFLAARISLINEVGNICQRLGVDVYEVAEGMGYDERIGSKFLNAGIGFGGSCLPKDLKALIAKSREIGYEPKILEEILNLNEQQPLRMVELLKKHIPDLRNRAIGMLGLAFKANTDDIRESRAIRVVDALLKEGAKIKAYDPVAMENFKGLFPQIEYTSPEEVLKSEAILILTDWEEFEHLDYKGRTVIDGRRTAKAREAKVYEGVCW